MYALPGRTLWAYKLYTADKPSIFQFFLYIKEGGYL